MIVNDTDVKQAKETLRALNDAKHEDPHKPEFWLWSDISNIHSNFLYRDHMIMPDYFHENLQRTVLKVLPEFQDIVSKPIHVKNVNAPDSDNTTIANTEANLDQQITRAGCEFFFQKFDNATLTQAYFLFPNASVIELSHLADEISIYHEAKKIQNITRVFVAIVTSKTIDYVKEKTFQEIWNALWTEFFDTTDINKLKEQFNIKNAPTTHLIPNHWTYVHYMLQDCAHNLDIYDTLTTEKVLNQCHESAKVQRNMLKKHTNQNPEDFLTPTNFKTTVEKIEAERKNFWSCYYPQTLR